MVFETRSEPVPKELLKPHANVALFFNNKYPTFNLKL